MLIGRAGENIKQMMDQYDVNLQVPGKYTGNIVIGGRMFIIHVLLGVIFLFLSWIYDIARFFIVFFSVTIYYPFLL